MIAYKNVSKGYSIKKVSGGDVRPTVLTHILGLGHLENFVRPPHMIVYGGNSVGGWSGKWCDSGGWVVRKKIEIRVVGGPRKSVRIPPTLSFLME